jgi:hypothetical protein
MSPHYAPFERDEYRLIFVQHGSRAIWAERGADRLLLPRVEVLTGRRPAEQLQEVIKSVWNIRVIVLDFLPPRQGSVPCAIAEILSSASHLLLTATRIDEIQEEEMSPEERVVLQSILDDDARARGPFSRVGWIKEAIEWLRSEIGHDVRLTEEIRQYNASARFALVRFGTTTGPAFWLKATGGPNAHEFEVTRKLAGLCPEFLPTQIAARKDWNAWLMEDAGQPLDSLDIQSLEQVVSSMGALQNRTIGWTDDFLAAGVFDQRVCTLQAHLPELMDYLREAMSKQTSTMAPRLDNGQLWRMESTLRSACARMEELQVPDTLVHNDVNPGNILFKGSQCVFTDWCETGVTNPFFGFEYLCRLQPRGGEDWHPRLREVYRQCWLVCLGASQVDEAFALAPLLAILSHLYGRGTWLHTSRRNAPYVEIYARSLARHMNRAMEQPRLQEALCR